MRSPKDLCDLETKVPKAAASRVWRRPYILHEGMCYYYNHACVCGVSELFIKYM